MGRLETMAHRLCHRGPDGQGFWRDTNQHIGFAHRRLAIIDLETGQQPMANENGRIVTVFNGEIYNYRELRSELISRGHQFATESDTEVIVHLYEEQGVEAVHSFRGMFAVAIWDGEQNQLVLFRDRVGQKPLYYAETGNEFSFGSEIKSLLAVMDNAVSIDTQSLGDYLLWGAVAAPRTVYEGLDSVEPAEVVIVRDRRIVHRKRYWRPTMHPKHTISRGEAVDCVDRQLRESVRMRLRSDVPVGAFLSGGIDSGLVTALAAAEYSQRLTTVTVGFDDAQFDERPLARQVAQRYGTEHHDVVVTPDLAGDLPTIAACYDQPFADSSAVPSYYVARTGRQFSKVVLNGDGGDELLGGYRKYVGARLIEILGWAGQSRQGDKWQRIHRLLPVPRRVRSAYHFFYRLVGGLSQEPASRYLAWTGNYFSAVDLKAIARASGGSAEAGQRQTAEGWVDQMLPATRLVDRFRDCLDDAEPTDWMLGMDLLIHLPDDLLVKMDIACMAHGLEARSPFLDHVLVDTVSRLPARMKVGWRTTKPLLRELARRYLPDEIRRAPKRGFEIPVIRWLRQDLREMTRDVLLSRNGLLSELFDRRGIERLINAEDGRDPARWARCVWALLMLGLWDARVRPSACQSSPLCPH